MEEQSASLCREYRLFACSWCLVDKKFDHQPASRFVANADVLKHAGASCCSRHNGMCFGEQDGFGRKVNALQVTATVISASSVMQGC